MCLYSYDEICYITFMSKYLASISNFRDLVEAWEKVKKNAPFNMMLFEIRCNHCDSKEISKYGRYKNIQRWWCKSCKRKFTDNRASPGMKTPSNMIQSAVSMYYNGVAIITIRRQLLADYNIYPSESIIHKWIYRDTETTLANTRDFSPKVGDRWMVFESSIIIGTDKLWLSDVVDLKTHFLIASRFSPKRSAEDMQALLQSAREKAQSVPSEILAKRKYAESVESVFGPGTKLVNKRKHPDEMIMIEYWHFVIRVRRKLFRRQKLLTLAQIVLNGWIFYQNYVVTQKTLKEKTAAQEAEIKYEYKSGQHTELFRL
jgi:putative transposase